MVLLDNGVLRFEELAEENHSVVWYVEYNHRHVLKVEPEREA